MAEVPQGPDTPPDELGEDLDLRSLASPARPVLTSAGRLQLRRIVSLSPLQRARVAVLQAACRRAQRALDALDFDTATDEQLGEAGAAVIAAENDLFRLLLVDPTDEQLEALGAPERVGLLAAFFGASPAEAREAVDRATAMLARVDSPGPKPPPDSSGSTAEQTRRDG